MTKFVSQPVESIAMFDYHLAERLLRITGGQGHSKNPVVTPEHFKELSLLDQDRYLGIADGIARKSATPASNASDSFEMKCAGLGGLDFSGQR